mmetsp:Transcript_94161/g.162857  ORF Transcript_94161/g.162857 Transcript_94161/m.162857 type:complete len:502 (+) Transcript_94161:812-2317(+)
MSFTSIRRMGRPIPSWEQRKSDSLLLPQVGPNGKTKGIFVNTVTGGVFGYHSTRRRRNREEEELEIALRISREEVEGVSSNGAQEDRDNSETTIALTNDNVVSFDAAEAFFLCMADEDQPVATKEIPTDEKFGATRKEENTTGQDVEMQAVAKETTMGCASQAYKDVFPLFKQPTTSSPKMSKPKMLKDGKNREPKISKDGKDEKPKLPVEVKPKVAKPSQAKDSPSKCSKETGVLQDKTNKQKSEAHKQCTTPSNKKGVKSPSPPKTGQAITAKTSKSTSEESIPAIMEFEEEKPKATHNSAKSSNQEDDNVLKKSKEDKPKPSAAKMTTAIAPQSSTVPEEPCTPMCTFCHVDTDSTDKVAEFITMVKTKDPSVGGITNDVVTDRLGPLLGPFDVSVVHTNTAKRHKQGPSDVFWAHDLCLLWCPEVYEDNRGQFLGLEHAYRRTKKGGMRCNFCDKPGATLGCHVESCKNSYHVACALLTSKGMDEENYIMFCPEHCG